MSVEEKAALSSLEEAISSAETDSNLLDSIAPEETEINNFGTSGFENNFTSAAVSQDNFELFEGAAVKKDSILDTFETEAVAEKVCYFFFSIDPNQCQKKISFRKKTTISLDKRNCKTLHSKNVF